MPMAGSSIVDICKSTISFILYIVCVEEWLCQKFFFFVPFGLMPPRQSSRLKKSLLKDAQEAEDLPGIGTLIDVISFGYSYFYCSQHCRSFHTRSVFPLQIS